MEIINDSFNTKGKCPYCESIFSYNSFDEEKIQTETIIFEDEVKRTKEKNPDCNYWSSFEFSGKIIKCPCCHKYMLVKTPRLILKKTSFH